jgi:hypothetical protein
MRSDWLPRRNSHLKATEALDRPSLPMLSMAKHLQSISRVPTLHSKLLSRSKPNRHWSLSRRLLQSLALTVCSSDPLTWATTSGEKIKEAAHAEGKKVGIYCTDGQQAQGYAQRGFDLISVCTDFPAITATFASNLSIAKGAATRDDSGRVKGYDGR